jgi:hypothetical protein
MNNIEYYIFLEEIQRMKKEYNRCKDKALKTEIVKDIELLQSAINYVR